jgi:hypothetical protein
VIGLHRLAAQLRGCGWTINQILGKNKRLTQTSSPFNVLVSGTEVPAQSKENIGYQAYSTLEGPGSAKWEVPSLEALKLVLRLPR